MARPKARRTARRQTSRRFAGAGTIHGCRSGLPADTTGLKRALAFGPVGSLRVRMTFSMVALSF